MQHPGLAATVETNKILFYLQRQQLGAGRQFPQVCDQPAVKGRADALPFPLRLDRQVVEVNKGRPDTYPEQCHGENPSSVLDYKELVLP